MCPGADGSNTVADGSDGILAENDDLRTRLADMRGSGRPEWLDLGQPPAHTARQPLSRVRSRQSPPVTGYGVRHAKVKCAPCSRFPTEADVIPAPNGAPTWWRARDLSLVER
jgi:hypothetical protein